MLSWILQSSKLATALEPTKTPPPCKPREQDQSPLGQWNVTQGSIRRKTHVALPQHTAYTVSVPVGQWMKVQGMFKMQTHRISVVVVDIAVFKVSHSVFFDIDATAL